MKFTAPSLAIAPLGLDRRRLAVGTGVSLGAALGMSATAEAADFTVTTLGDSGAGSLRQAILDANAAPGADRVLFNSNLSGTLSVSSGQLAITGPVDIVGPGANRLTVRGNGSSRLIKVDLVTSPGAGKDGLCGGPGADRLLGGKGKDVLKGGPGKDQQTQ